MLHAIFRMQIITLRFPPVVYPSLNWGSYNVMVQLSSIPSFTKTIGQGYISVGQ